MIFKKTNVLRIANIVRQNVQKKRLLNSYHSLLITFSGGQDSAFCLLLLYLLQSKIKFRRDSAHKSFACLQKRSLPLNLQNFVLHDPHRFAKTKFLHSTRSFAYNFVLKETENLCKSASFVQSFDNDYTLLWCNHFWQKDSFFTMEHISKLSFSFCYTTYFFIPITKILSEQNARNWRQKGMQRCLTLAFYKNQNRISLSIHQIKFNSVERYTSLRLQKGIFDARFSCLCFTLYVQNFVLQPMRAKLRFAWAAKRSFARKLIASKKRSFLYRRRLGLQNEVLQAKPRKSQRKNSESLHPPMQTKSKNKADFVSSLKFYEQLCVQGHNKSDRAESILFNLIRGTGMNGMSTLQWKHAFFLCKSNHKFYPVFFGYKKENVDYTSKLVLFCRVK